MSKLLQQMIDETEAAILSKKLMPNDYDNLPAISYRDYDDAEYGWNLINKSDKNYYIQFASNGGGMTSYGFYKANNGQIYIIEAWINKITKIYIPNKKWDCLEKLIQDDEYTKL